MYIDCNKNPDDLAVIFNGKLQTLCHTADDEEGYIKRYLRSDNEDGKDFQRDEIGEIKSETLYGEVKFVPVVSLNSKYLTENNITVE